MRALFKRVFGSSHDGKFGTLAGVFTPSVVTLLGVIMYLRLGLLEGTVGRLAVGRQDDLVLPPSLRQVQCLVGSIDERTRR